MANVQGDWVWYELMTPDADGAQSFYSKVLDWKIANPAQDGFDYREIQAADDGYIGGILALTPEMQGVHPGWVGYIAVDNVDASVSAIIAAGGREYMPARDMEGVGRFAMVTDPQGAAFYVMTSATGETSHAFASDKPRPGHCAWNELATTDQAAALAFYSGQFGWSKDGEMDMGPMGKYEFLRHGSVIGALMTKMPQQPVSAWTFYFRVPDIDAALEIVTANGGKILNGPHQVPGGDWTINGMDPQGAAFALVGQKA
jgi:uncharacterized protein